jgi:2-hydroxycyclohexanecarboxyl-CoA dehydrogenase
MTSPLAGHTAVVSGAGSGIGRAIAERLAVLGARVAVVDVDAVRAQRASEEIGEAGGSAAAFRADITSDADLSALCTDVHRQLDRPTIVVNNVGWDDAAPFLDTDSNFWRRVVEVNLLGPIALTHAFARGMVEAGRGGRVINIASDAGRVGSSGSTVYSGSKGGVIAFTKALARELAREGINVNCICPGPTDTPLLASQPQRLRDALVRAIPLRRIAQPHEIAGAVAFLAGDDASYITGQVLSVNGGLTMVG